ncbi:MULTISPECIES: dodecin domain-containing protein [Streptomyces]|uniref:Dodecin domain-containing protein n=1 Tax=Streptomyces galilaeus TaxID=33899 RepID=A0ABW9ISH0_STRGJ
MAFGSSGASLCDAAKTAFACAARTLRTVRQAVVSTIRKRAEPESIF